MMKVSKTLLNTIMVAVAAGTITSCGKSVEGKPAKKMPVKIGSTENTPAPCPACGMG